MALSVKHKFTSNKADGADASLARPSDWNADHDITLSANAIVGRATAGSGAAEEIPCTAVGRSILAAASAAAVLEALGIAPPTTGDIQLTIKKIDDVPAGWILMDDGTIGDASSSATTRANADCEALFKMLWSNITDTYAPVVGGRGLTAAADWAAHKKITLTKVLGRALAAAGSGTGLSNRALGLTVGAESDTIDKANLPNMDFAVTIPSGQGAHAHNYTYPTYTSVNSGTNAIINYSPGTGVTATSQATLPALSGTAASGGSAEPVSLMQPTAFLNVMIRL